MQPKTPKWLDDIRRSSEFIRDAIQGKSLASYSANPLLQAAVERHFEIIGEAMGRIARGDPETAGQIEDYQHIIAFRNVLTHSYDVVATTKCGA